MLLDVLVVLMNSFQIVYVLFMCAVSTMSWTYGLWYHCTMIMLISMITYHCLVKSVLVDSSSSTMYSTSIA